MKTLQEICTPRKSVFDRTLSAPGQTAWINLLQGKLLPTLDVAVAGRDENPARYALGGVDG